MSKRVCCHVESFTQGTRAACSDRIRGLLSVSARPARAREQEACHGPSLGRSSRIRLRGRWTIGASFGTGSTAMRTERLMPSQASLDGRATATSEQLAAPPDEEQRAFEAPKNRLQKLRPKPILWASKKLSRSAARPVVAPCAPRARSVETGASPEAQKSRPRRRKRSTSAGEWAGQPGAGPPWNPACGESGSESSRDPSESAHGL